MTTMHEMTREQQEILDMLFWQPTVKFDEETGLPIPVDDEAEETEHTRQLRAKLNALQGNITKKLEFLTTVYAELKLIADGRAEVARQSALRKKQADNAIDRLKKFVQMAMEASKIKRVDGLYKGFNIQKGRLTPIFQPDFDINSLPSSCIKVIPEEKKVINKEVINLVTTIKDDVTGRETYHIIVDGKEIDTINVVEPNILVLR